MPGDKRLAVGSFQLEDLRLRQTNFSRRNCDAVWKIEQPALTERDDSERDDIEQDDYEEERNRDFQQCLSCPPEAGAVRAFLLPVGVSR